jgi:hypothetical protein
MNLGTPGHITTKVPKLLSNTRPAAEVHHHFVRSGFSHLRLFPSIKSPLLPTTTIHSASKHHHPQQRKQPQMEMRAQART